VTLACYDYSFESRRGHGRVSVVSFVCYQGEVFATGRSFVQRIPPECVYVYVCVYVIENDQVQRAGIAVQADRSWV